MTHLAIKQEMALHTVLEVTVAPTVSIEVFATVFPVPSRTRLVFEAIVVVCDGNTDSSCSISRIRICTPREYSMSLYALFSCFSSSLFLRIEEINENIVSSNATPPTYMSGRPHSLRTNIVDAASCEFRDRWFDTWSLNSPLNECHCFNNTCKS